MRSARPMHVHTVRKAAKASKEAKVAAASVARAEAKTAADSLKEKRRQELMR